VPLPDVEGRRTILQAHASRLPLETAVAGRGGSGGSTRAPLTGHAEGAELASAKDCEEGSPLEWSSWAKRTPGFSGADLANLVNEAAMAAAREGAWGVGQRHVQAAYSKVLLGVPSGRRPSKTQLALTAAHEAGHAVVNEAMRKMFGDEGTHGFHTVAHISIVPAGHAGGVTQFAEPEEGAAFPRSRRVLLAELAVAMGGRAAEELRHGKDGATMGARGDFSQATRLATDMVQNGGLSEDIGPHATGFASSEEMRRKVDLEVNKLLRQALERARKALANNDALFRAVAKALLQHETVNREAFQQLVKHHGITAVTL